MRSRKTSPAERANSQAISAVRRLPTCNEPVGDGANRPGIADSVPSACGRRAPSHRLDGMQCHVCGTAVRPEHKFCMECGARLRRPTSDLALAPPAIESEESDRLPVLSTPASHPMFDPTTGHLLAIPPPPPLPPPDEDATNVLPAVGAPLGRGGFGPPDVSAQGPGRWDHPSDSGPLWPSEALGYADEAAPATTMQPPYRTEYDGAGSLRRHGTGAGHLRAVGRAGRRPVGGRRTADRTAGLPGQAAADHRHPRRGGRHRRHGRADPRRRRHGSRHPRRGVEAQRLRYQPHRRRHRHRA